MEYQLNKLCFDLVSSLLYIIHTIKYKCIYNVNISYINSINSMSIKINRYATKTLIHDPEIFLIVNSKPTLRIYLIPVQRGISATLVAHPQRAQEYLFFLLLPLCDIQLSKIFKMEFNSKAHFRLSIIHD